MLYKFRKQVKCHEAETFHLKEELLKIKSGKEKLKENLEKYQKENKKLQEAARKKRKKRTDAGKHRDDSSKKKRSGKPKGANGGGLKNPPEDQIDYTRHCYLKFCPNCKRSFKNVEPFEEYPHYLRDLELLNGGLRLIHVKYIIHRYRCPGCKNRVQEEFGGLKNGRYGLGLIAFVLAERFERGGSWEGIRSTLDRIVRFRGPSPTVAAFIGWIKKYEPEMGLVHDEFVNVIRASSCVNVDETGLPMDGENWWLWVCVAREVVLYISSETRGSDAIKDVFYDFKGVLVSDFWTAYNKLSVEQQKCLQHLSRELKKIHFTELDKRKKASKALEIDDGLKTREKKRKKKNDPIPKKRGRPAKQIEPLSPEKRKKLEHVIVQSEKASRQATKFYDFFKGAWDKKGGDMSFYTPSENRISIKDAEAQLNILIQEIIEEGPANADIKRIIKRFKKYAPCLFTYLEHLDVPPDNNAAERELRPFVVQRKISGTFISSDVMKTYSRLLSLYRTCKKNDVKFHEVLIPLLKGNSKPILELLGLKTSDRPP